jgi:DNA-binding transcriptional MocR family regulator
MSLQYNPSMGAIQKDIRGRRAAAIAASVEAQVREGRLAPGAALPTVRALARRLEVSPTTVAAAYRTLRARGLVVAAGRRGTRVSPAPPVPPTAFAPRPLPPGVRDLATGNPDPALLPRLAPALARLARADPDPHLYAEAVHLPALLERAAADFAADGIPADALSVVSGALDGIERVLLAHLRPGDAVAVEDPAFAGVLHLVRALGLVPVAVAVDDAGPRPAPLARALRGGARAFVLTPRAHNPFGSALDAARAAALRAVLHEHPGVLVVEDDHAGAAAGVAAHSVCAAGVERWAVVRSVSKTLGPDLRLAVLAGDAETVARVEGRQLLGTRWVSHLLQHLVVDLWADRTVQRLLARAARTYAERRAALVGALEARGIPAHGRSGLNVWIPVPEETAAVQGLLAAGFAVRAGEVYRLEAPPAIRVTTAALPAEQAPRLAEALARLLAPAGRTAGS